MRLPLFVWAMYGTSIIQVLATPVLALSLAIVGIDHWLDWGLFDPARGGRSGALPAPLLVLLAPGRLHHDPAGDGRHQRGRPHVQPQEPVLVQGDRVLHARHRVRRLSHVGASHVRGGHVRLRRRRLRGPLDARRHLLRDQGLHLGADDAKRLDRREDPVALRLRVPVSLRLRRHDRRRGRDDEPRRPLARHVLRRRPFSLHHGRRDAHRRGSPRSTTGFRR